MRITDALRGEHGALYALFELLERTLETGTGEELRAQGALLAAVLVSHAALENAELFPALEPRIGASGPLAVMRAEHDEIERTVVGVSRLADPDAVRAALRHALSVAREHFRKEEAILFPLAEQQLPAASLADLGARWAALRGVTLG